MCKCWDNCSLLSFEILSCLYLVACLLALPVPPSAHMPPPPLSSTGAGGYADGANNCIHPRHLSSHRLWASEILSVESLLCFITHGLSSPIIENKLVTPLV